MHARMIIPYLRTSILRSCQPSLGSRTVGQAGRDDGNGTRTGCINRLLMATPRTARCRSGEHATDRVDEVLRRERLLDEGVPVAAEPAVRVVAGVAGHVEHAEPWMPGEGGSNQLRAGHSRHVDVGE